MHGTLGSCVSGLYAQIGILVATRGIDTIVRDCSRLARPCVANPRFGARDGRVN